MDSMRSLNSSLPSSTPHSKSQSPEQLLQAFKSAALSVTNLYKSAVSDHADARQQGYQDALEDLLVFLDKENLGLMDGEGWKVRQWATERYSRAQGAANLSDVEEEAVDEETRARSSSPARPQRQATPNQPVHESSVRNEPSESSTTSTQTQQLETPTTNPLMFTFSATAPATVLDTDMSISEQTSEGGSSEQRNNTPPPAKPSEPPLRLEVLGRGSRTPHRHGNSSRHSQRSTNRDIHLNNSTKRKLQFPDFFDLSNFGNGLGKDSTGGSSKRGRFA